MVRQQGLGLRVVVEAISQVVDGFQRDVDVGEARDELLKLLDVGLLCRRQAFHGHSVDCLGHLGRGRAAAVGFALELLELFADGFLLLRELFQRLLNSLESFVGHEDSPSDTDGPFYQPEHPRIACERLSLTRRPA